MSQCCVDDELMRGWLQPFVLAQAWEKKMNSLFFLVTVTLNCCTVNGKTAGIIKY